MTSNLLYQKDLGNTIFLALIEAYAHQMNMQIVDFVIEQGE